jgi:hypothetical protein
MRAANEFEFMRGMLVGASCLQNHQFFAWTHAPASCWL